MSVVVPTRDRPDHLARCLASLAATLRHDDELIVVDSASIDADAIARVVAEAGRALVRCDLPGVCRARNAGWRAARHDLLVFTDDDVTHDPTWLDAFAAAFAEHPDAAFLTGRIGMPPGQTARLHPVALKDDDQAEVFDRSSVGNLGHSASLAVRRSALEAVGGFDEVLGAGGHFRAVPEHDLFDRLFAAGFSGRYEPSARAYHDQWRSRRQVVRLDFGYGIGNGARIAKLVRYDRARARLIARHAFGSWGFGELVHFARQRRVAPMPAVAARLAGTGLGFVRGLATPIEGQHFRLRRGPR
jgi:glycosyltransferase involved in cell wall biosynthesis